MIEVVKVELDVTIRRLGIVHVNYFGLVLFCEVCVYKKEKLWIRMPELWINKKEKKQFVWWESKIESDKFQEIILNKVFDMVGLTLKNAIEMRNDFFKKTK